MGNLTHTVSGNIASFKTAARVPIESLKCHFAPKQDLHGYSKPWPGGGGKNLFNINASEQNPSNTTTTNDTVRIFTPGTYAVGTSYSNYFMPANIISYSINNNTLSVKNKNVYGIGFVFALTAGETYYLSATTDDGKVHSSFYDNEGNKLTINSYNRLNASFTVPNDAAITVLTFYSNTEGENGGATFSNIQLEKGSSATSYEPYENICPIEGWNQCKISKTSKSIVPFIKNTFTAISNYNGNAGWSVPWKIPDRTIKYIYSVYIDNTNGDAAARAQVWLRNIDDTAYVDGIAISGTDIAAGASGWSKVICNPATRPNTYYFVFGLTLRIGTIASYPIVEIGDTSSEYEPYRGQTIPVTFYENLFFESTRTSNLTLNADGTEKSETNMIITNSIAVTAGNSYILEYISGYNARTRRVIGYDSNGDFAQSLYSASWVTTGSKVNTTITIPSGVVSVRMCVYDDDTEVNFHSNTPLTVYGGYVDVAKGEVVATEIKRIITAETPCISYSKGYASSYCAKYDISDIPGANDNITYFSHGGIRERSSASLGYPTPGQACALPYNDIVTTIQIGQPKNVTIITKDEWLDWLEVYGPLEYCYKLATPIHYPILKAQLQTLLNQNNIYSNTNGQTEVSYAIHDSAMIRAAKARIAANEPHIETASGSIASFQTEMIAPIKSAKVYFNPVQEGTGDPSPTNVRNISGWTGLTIGEGSNYNKLIPISSMTKTTKNGITIEYLGNGKYHIYGQKDTEADVLLDKIDVNSFIIPGDTGKYFKINNSAAVSLTYIYFYSSTGSHVDYWALTPANRSASNYGTMSNRECGKFSIKIGNNTNYLDFTIEPEFYTTTGIQTYPISWPSTAGTVYGGYVDLIKGEIIEDTILIDMNTWLQTNTVEMVNGYLCRFRYTGLLDAIACSHFIKSPNGNWGYMTTAEGNLCLAGSGYIGFSSSTLELTTKEEWIEWLTNNNVQLTVKLATPITYQLDPQTLTTLRGTNNIWSSANGNIELSYWTH